MSSTPAIEAVDLVKRFGDTTAVDGVSFVVPSGTVLGLLGPNGAGKTTIVRMMTTLIESTSGTARVAGHDVQAEPEQVRRNMGLTGQVATVDELLTGRENIRMIGGLRAADGANDASSFVQNTATTCPDTKIVLGGYSQGAAVVDIITVAEQPTLGFAEPMPANIADMSPRWRCSATRLFASSAAR